MTSLKSTPQGKKESSLAQAKLLPNQLPISNLTKTKVDNVDSAS